VGAAERDITPAGSVFLYGYPHVPRMSTGVHDPLLASAIFLDDGRCPVVFVACDLIWLPRDLTIRAAGRIEQLTGVPAGHVIVTATHTHSGPVTTRMISNEADPVVPAPDGAYLDRLEECIVEAARLAHADARPATVRLGRADAAGVGTNRRDPAGPADLELPVLVARARSDGAVLAVMTVCAMHPTVLHEDSTLISGDFPGLARRRLRGRVLEPGRPLVYHTGAAGDQSPRHVTAANTPAEAERLGGLLADAIVAGLAAAEPVAPSLSVESLDVELPLRELPGVPEAEDRVRRAAARVRELAASGAPAAAVRTAEVDAFGAEETLALARAARTGRLREAADRCRPIRVTLVRIGPLALVCWPGEVFVEFALQVRRRHPEAHVIALAGGELQGYLVTQQAVDQGAYEAGNAIFAGPPSGRRLVEAALALLERAGGTAGRTP